MSNAQEAKISEAQIQRQILDWLAAEHILAFRMNTGAVKAEGRFFRFGVRGMADILAFPSCQRTAVCVVCDTILTTFGMVLPIWIECKAAKGKQTAEQKSFQEQVERHGHRYIVARSLEDVEEVLR